MSPKALSFYSLRDQSKSQQKRLYCLAGQVELVASSPSNHFEDFLIAQVWTENTEARPIRLESQRLRLYAYPLRGET